MKFRRNIGPKNRIARLVAGSALIVLAAIFFNSHVIPAAAGFTLGVILLVESASSFCIIHRLRGTKDLR